LIIAGDVVEHLEKEKAVELLDNIYGRATKGFILNLPIGEEWLRECEHHENKHEAHLSWWDMSDFEGLKYDANIFEMVNGSKYSIIWFSEINLNYNRLLRKADRFLNTGDIDSAAPFIKELIDLFPDETAPYLLKVEILLGHKLFDEVYKTLETLIERVPQYADGYIFYLDILQKTGNNELLHKKAADFIKLDFPQTIKEQIQSKIS
ncbi:MAG: hypothetical protein HQK84_07645, partial [Nitrospinae bacterium]|nr:hypothetical protein [Nitrospinota bacterium]